MPPIDKDIEPPRRQRVIHQHRETGVTPMATCPSPRALLFMLRQAGFRRAEILKPHEGAYEQHARGKRVVCAAWK